MVIKLKSIKKKKKAASLLVSYVLLISIVIGISIGVFVWLKYIATDVEPEINCEIGTSVIVESYSCEPGSLKLIIKNNGLFNVNGVNVKVSDDVNKEPVTELAPAGVDLPGTLLGHYLFSDPLKPNEGREVSFGRTPEIIGLSQSKVTGYASHGSDDMDDDVSGSDDMDDGGGVGGIGGFIDYPIKVISVQPFITNADKLIYCSDSVIKENLVDCEI